VDARQLEYFLAIVEHDGFGRAAAALHVAQPSLSQAMGNLERDLGVPLFHRIGRGVTVSDAGRALIEPARQVLRDLETARATMESLKGVERGRVELVSMPSPAIEPLGRLTRAFLDAHPGVLVSVEAAFTPDQVVEQVRQGAVELGLVGSSAPLHPPGLDTLPLERQAMVLVASSDSPFPTDDPVAPSALAGARLIVSPRGSLMREVVDQVLAAGVPLRVVAEVAHRTSILPLVLQGVGMAVLPSAWAPLARRAGAQTARLDLPDRLHVALLSRQAPLTPAAAAFLALGRAHAGAGDLRRRVPAPAGAEPPRP
jgi:DNA-binding transcriptional LysR family regulator